MWQRRGSPQPQVRGRRHQAGRPRRPVQVGHRPQRRSKASNVDVVGSNDNDVAVFHDANVEHSGSEPVAAAHDDRVCQPLHELCRRLRRRQLHRRHQPCGRLKDRSVRQLFASYG